MRGAALSVEQVVAELAAERARYANAAAEAEENSARARSARAAAEVELKAARLLRATASAETRAEIEGELESARREIGKAVARLQSEGALIDVRIASAQASDLSARVATLQAGLATEGSPGLSKRAMAAISDNGNSDRDVKSCAPGDVLLHVTLGEVTVDATGKQGPTVLSGGLRVRAKWRDCVEIIRTAAQDAALLKGDTSWSPSPGSSPASIIARLAASSGKRPRIAGGQSAVTSRPTAQVAANTVDVRGQFAESAVDAVETQISKANQYGAIYVIHGHGTGRLREACREALAAHPFVSRIADAPDSQGGRGCTIAYLKD